MGLDMYLDKEIYVGAMFDHRDVKAEVQITIGGVPLSVNPRRISTITEEACYWRKANAIHQWFVENVQEGEDDCGRYYVDVDLLKNLLAICKEIEADHSKAPALLPTMDGFFFGSLEYDEWYFKDISATIKALEELKLEEPLSYSVTYYYHSSW